MTDQTAPPGAIIPARIGPIDLTRCPACAEILGTANPSTLGAAS